MHSRTLDEKTTAAIFYTTGTTGDPKGVSYSHRQIVLHTARDRDRLCARRERARDCIAKTSTCPSHPCSTCWRGACPMSPSCSVSRSCFPAGICRKPCFGCAKQKA
ncbi:AMP-binding protein [Cupriavidus basilensis]